MSTARPLPMVIGPTENALRALLTKTLAPTRIRTYRSWVILNAVSNAGAPSSGAAWQPAVADALKVELDAIDEGLTELRAAGLVGGDNTLTAAGAAELAAGRAAVSTTTLRLVDGIAEEEQATVRRVLEQVRHRAEDLLRL